jgi:hypothetical protein
MTGQLGRLADRSAAHLALIWAGISIGVAFVATPAKFLAPSLTLPVALDVGRQTFHVYNAVEVCLSVLALGFSLCSDRRRRWLLNFAMPIAVVAVQALWLIPSLDSRIFVIQAGRLPTPSHLHAEYVILEAAKIFGLLASTYWMRLPRPRLDEL